MTCELCYPEKNLDHENVWICSESHNHIPVMENVRKLCIHRVCCCRVDIIKDFSNLCKFPHLEELELSYLDVKGRSIVLKGLKIRKLIITGCSNVFVRECPNLEVIEAKNSENLKFSELPALQCISVRGRDSYDEFPPVFSLNKFPKLKKVYCSNGCIGEIGNCPELVDVKLAEYVYVMRIWNCPKLKTVDLENAYCLRDSELNEDVDENMLVFTSKNIS